MIDAMGMYGHTIYTILMIRIRSGHWRALDCEYIGRRRFSSSAYARGRRVLREESPLCLLLIEFSRKLPMRSHRALLANLNGEYKAVLVLGPQMSDTIADIMHCLSLLSALLEVACDPSQPLRNPGFSINDLC